MPKTPQPTTDDDCTVCKGLLGPLDTGDGRMHYFCSWARPEDWAALRPFFTGTLEGVQAGGG